MNATIYLPLISPILAHGATLTSLKAIQTINTTTIPALQQSITFVSNGLESESETRNQQVEAINTALEGKSDTDHTHDAVTVRKAGFMTTTQLQHLIDAYGLRHSHENKDVLDTYSFSNQDVLLAIDEAHTHANIAALNNTTAAFTSALYNKLNGIAEGANKTVVDTAIDSNSTNPVQNKVISSELQSIWDEIRSIPSITVDTAISTTSTNPVQNKVITSKFQDIDDAIDEIELKKLESTVIEIAGTITLGDTPTANLSFTDANYREFLQHKDKNLSLFGSDYGSNKRRIFTNEFITELSDGSWVATYRYTYSPELTYLLSVVWSSSGSSVDEYITERHDVSTKIDEKDILILNCGKADLWDSEE